jgi:hypothetical protein
VPALQLIQTYTINPTGFDNNKKIIEDPEE